MALSLKDPETDRLARQVARLTGESLTEAIRTSLAERLRREQLKRGRPGALADALEAIVGRNDSLQVLDGRSAEEILGYDENGIPSPW
jgi:antitoxin VapB